MNLNSFVDWFIASSRKESKAELKKARLFVRALLFNSLFSITYYFSGLYLDFTLASILMMLDAIGLVILVFLVKTRISIIILGHIYIFIGAVSIFFITYYSGGMWSSAYPWIISVPLAALLVVNRNAGIIWGVIAYLVMLWMAYLAMQGVEFPVLYDQTKKTLVFAAALPGLLLITMMIAMVFEKVQREALEETIEKNALLESQKDTIQNQSKDLETLIGEKDQIIRIMAHDLKNPLANISSLSKLMKENNSIEEKREIADLIYKVTGKAQDLVTKLLDIAILEQGGIVIHKERLDLMTIVKNAVDELSKMAKSKNIAINVESDLSSCDVLSDKTYLFLIFENLISNALKFSPMDTSVNVEVSRHQEEVRVKVSDQGPGIKPEEEHLLFQKFSLLSSKPTAGENSTGIGLSLVKAYIKKLGGKIWYQGVYGKGSDFIVQLPLTS